VQGIELADGEIFKVNPATGLFARFDPVQGSFIGESAAQRPEGARALTELAEGTGTTGDEAIRDALGNAVRKAVGVLVDGEVLIKKEDVISDKVLTYSDGFVTSYEELGRKQEDGLVHVSIRAQVEQRKLLANLRAAGVSLGAVDGKGLVASAVTRKEALDTAASLLSKTLAELPNVLKAEVQPPTALDYDVETQLLNLSVAIRVDRPKYYAYADSLAAILKQISLASTSILLQGAPSLGNGDHLLDRSQGTLGPILRFGPDLSGNPKSWCLWLGMRGDERHGTIRLACFALDANIARALQSTRGKFQVEIDLLDAQKEEIARDVFDPLVGVKRRSLWLGWLAPRPRQQVAQFQEETPADLLGAGNLALLSQQINPQMSVNAYVAPICVAGLENGNIFFSRGVWQARAVKIAPSVLNRVTEIHARVVFVPAENSTGGPRNP
jgi:hypothetical protein